MVKFRGNELTELISKFSYYGRLPFTICRVTTGSIPNTDVEKIVACMKDGAMEAIAPLLVQFGSYRKSRLIQPITLEQMADRYRKEGI